MPPILPAAESRTRPLFRLGRRPERLSALVGVDLEMPFLKALVTATAAAAGCPRALVLSERRDRTLVTHRHAGMWIAYHATLRPLPEIGRAFHRDHTTVLHAIQATERRLAETAAETTAVIQRIALHLLRATPPMTPAEQIRQAAEKAERRKAAAISAAAGERMRDAGSRGWFQANDARFCAAFVAAHPERVGEELPA